MWNDGYVSEIGYCFGYFPELSPARLKLALLAQGIGHAVGDAPAYLELGFGQGLSLAIHAATGSGAFYGTDFMPAQAVNAARFGAASGKPVHAFDQSFEQLAARADLPMFDIITMHGIWSWVSDSGRAAILDIIDKRLKPGGIVFVSYNVATGWSPIMPLRQLVFQHHQRATAGGMVDRIDQSLEFATRIRDFGVGYFGANPMACTWLDRMKARDRHYLAHEYFNANWRPESFADVADRMASAKLGYAASANLLDVVGEWHLAPELRGILAEIGDPVLREVTKDVLINRQFRTDIYVKGARTLSPNERLDAMCAHSFVRSGFVPDMPVTLDTRYGPIDLHPDLMTAASSCFDAADGGVASFVDLCTQLAPVGLAPDHVIQAVVTMAAAGHVSATTQSETIAEDYFATLRLNREICRQARYNGAVGFVAAAGIGEGVQVGRLPLLVLHAMAEEIEDIADYVVDTLGGQGETRLTDTIALDDMPAVRAHLDMVIGWTRDTLLPNLERIGAVASASGNPFAVPTADIAAHDGTFSRSA